MVSIRVIVTCVAFGLLSGTASAAPAMPCAKRDELVKLLDEKYKESQTGYGTVGEKSVIEVYKSEKGSFTVISTYPNGVSCIIAAGQNWEGVEAPKRLTNIRFEF